MAVKLHIVEASYDGSCVEPFEVPDGHTITVRRHSQGADVFVVPRQDPAELEVTSTEAISATLAQFLALDSCARDVGGAELALLGTAGERVNFLLSNRELASLASAIGEHFGTPGSIRETEVLARIAMLERRADQPAEPAGASHLRDMGATLVDKARARWLDARAAKLEAEIREDHGAPPDDGHSPVLVKGWSIEGRSDLTITRATLTDTEGREYKLNLPPDQARELAEQLLSGARFAETGRGR